MPGTLPGVLPVVAEAAPGAVITADIDTGGYDVMIGGHGFRLATGKENPYIRSTEPVTARRLDSSVEPGEQSLSNLPWIKSQSSFHAGAGQLNLEQGLTSFEYQQEKIEHIRFDTCQGVDVWTLGKVTRLPATRVVALSGSAYNALAVASVGSTDYAIGGGDGNFEQIEWATGPDDAPTISDIDLSGATFGGASNCEVTSVVTDGANYYALIQLTIDGSTANVRTLLVKGDVSSTSAPTVIYKSAANSTQLLGVLGWAKARLVAGLGRSLYELDTAPSSPPVDISTLTPKYTHPSANWSWTVFSESPYAILGAGSAGLRSDILAFELDTSGGVPTLTGGASAGSLPQGEVVHDLTETAGSFLIIGTSRGVRVATFDGFTGKLKIGPVSVTTTEPVLAVTTRDRFAYGGFTDQQEDGTTGLVRLDMSMIVDTAGRLAYAPDLQPPRSAPTGNGAVTRLEVLPLSNRIVWVSDDGLHVEQGAPAVDDPAWLRTSRIRFDTTENKLFKFGRVTGSLTSSTIKVEGITLVRGTEPIGTFGFTDSVDPGEFTLPSGLHEWLQLQFTLNGADCIMNSYHVKAYPSPAPQNIIMFTVHCFREEVDRSEMTITDPELPRQRWQNVLDLKNSGVETRLVEFTLDGATAESVMIDQIEFRSPFRPDLDEDFGGYITFKLRKTSA